jgi:ATP/maltotriose-dependent transcriptional regulator MalT
LWYQVDEGDADPATFFYYMGLAAKKTFPRKRKPLPLLTPEYLQGMITFTQRYFEDLYRRLKIPSVLVLDNYQEVPPESPFHEVILNGLSRIPEKINAILVSNAGIPGPFAPTFVADSAEWWYAQEVHIRAPSCSFDQCFLP